MNTLFLDTEFTGLTQQAQLISLALLSDDDRYFYAEFSDYDPSLLSDWHRQNVLPYLHLKDATGTPNLAGPRVEIQGDKIEVADALKRWLASFDALEIWADCPVYDWVLFCELFGGALHLPKNIYYLPFDLVTLFKSKGLDPDTDRRTFAGLDARNAGPQHNALTDARVTKACYDKLISL